MSEYPLVFRVEEIERRLNRIEESLKKTVKERELTLKDKFAIHDHAQRLIRWFEELMMDVPEENVWFCQMNPTKSFIESKRASIKDLKEIIKEFSALVDNALGVKFP